MAQGYIWTREELRCHFHGRRWLAKVPGFVGGCGYCHYHDIVSQSHHFYYILVSALLSSDGALWLDGG